MNFIEYDDLKMFWFKSYFNYVVNKKKIIMYEWLIIMVDVEGIVDVVLNFCMN